MLQNTFARALVERSRGLCQFPKAASSLRVGRFCAGPQGVAKNGTGMKLRKEAGFLSWGKVDQEVDWAAGQILIPICGPSSLTWPAQICANTNIFPYTRLSASYPPNLQWILCVPLDLPVPDRLGLYCQFLIFFILYIHSALSENIVFLQQSLCLAK